MPRITPIHWKTLEKIFIKDGFEFRGQTVSHRKYWKEGLKRPVIIPVYDQVRVEVIKSNLTTAGMSREQYFEYLKDCK